ncbi:MAG: hypothetical protein ACM3U2_23120 [Deltaproteobacteria bacterium]
MKLPQFDRLPLILTGALLAAGAAGCHCGRDQSDGDCPQVSYYGAAAPAGAPPAGSPGYAAASTNSRGPHQSAPLSRYEESTNRARRPNGQFPSRDDFDTDAGPVTLPSPNDGKEGAERTRRSLALPVFRRHVAASARTHSAGNTWGLPGARPVRRSPGDSGDAAAYAAVDSADRPHGWTGRPANRMAREAGTGPHALPVSLNRTPDTADPGREPIRVVDPPRLRTTPADDGSDMPSEADRSLAIPRILVCREVRGFEDVVELDARQLRQGQPLLIYATLENFRSMATPKGYRTLTLSTLEIRKADGEVLQRQPLGTAVDLVEVPRRDFFLTHLITIPDDLPAGEYLFDLYIDDLLKHESAQARVAVRVTEDRSRRDGTADTSKFATRPAGSRR